MTRSHLSSGFELPGTSLFNLSSGHVEKRLFWVFFWWRSHQKDT